MLDQENESISAFRKGDRRAVEDMLSLHANRLLRSAFLLCGNEPDAHDIIQETFLQAIKSGHRYEGRSSVYTWLYGILLNVFHQFCRKKRPLNPRLFLLNKEECGIREVEHNIDLENTGRKIWTLIHSLSIHHREVIILRYWEELKIQEIAGLLGISKGTVKSRLHYATAELRNKASRLNLLQPPGHSR